jgi:hypothetical protein
LRAASVPLQIETGNASFTIGRVREFFAKNSLIDLRMRYCQTLIRALLGSGQNSDPYNKFRITSPKQTRLVGNAEVIWAFQFVLLRSTNGHIGQAPMSEF